MFNPRRSITGKLISGLVWRRHNGRRWIYKEFVDLKVQTVNNPKPNFLAIMVRAENLIHSDLTAAQRKLVARRKAAYEAVH